MALSRLRYFAAVLGSGMASVLTLLLSLCFAIPCDNAAAYGRTILFGTQPTAKASVAPKDIKLTPDGDVAGLVIEKDYKREFSLVEYMFVKIDMESSSRDSGFVRVDSWDNTLETDDPSLVAHAPSLFKHKDKSSRFTASTIARGDYALIRLTEEGATNSYSYCLKDGSPVFRFEGGKINVIRAAFAANALHKRYDEAMMADKTDPTADLKTVLKGYPKMAGQIVIREPIAYYTFRGTDGLLNPCSKVGQPVRLR